MRRFCNRARVCDRFKTLGELENQRQRHRERVLCLTLLRDNVIAAERYVLDRTDLRLAELISPEEYEERTSVAFLILNASRRRSER
jgi:hypothetical protein